MTEEQYNQLEKFADDFGLEFERPTALDQIWSYCVGFLASIGLLFVVVLFAAWYAGAFK